MKTLRMLMAYMGRRRALLPLSLLLSALSELAGLVPYVLVWLIVKSLLTSGPVAGGERAVAYAWWAAGIAAAGVVLYFAALTSSHLAAFRVESNLRRSAMRRITAMPLGFFELHPSGRVRKVIDDNAGITHSFLAHQLPDLAATLLVPPLALLLMLWLDWRMGLACLVPLAVAMLIMGYTMNTRGREFMAAYMSLLERMNAEAVEYVRGIPVVKVFQQTVFSFKSFHACIMAYKETAARYTRLWEVPMTVYTVMINSFVFLLVPIAALLLTAPAGRLDVLLDWMLLVLLTPVFSQSIMKSMYLGQAVGQAREAVGRLDALLAYAPLPVPSSPAPVADATVRFEHVRFRYPDAADYALDDVSLFLPEGSTTALVGPSGSGKTTLARLVPRFWDVASGCVRVGGADVRSVAPAELMRHVSFVFQHPRLFKGTLLDNIRYARPDATPAEVERAVSLARCDEIVARLPHGLQTRIGTGGTYLSGGEQQRVALARALLKDAPIVLLDEATAFADPENERLITQALRELTRGRTVLLIAHRLTTVAGADRIVVMDRGRVVESGTHAQLLAAGGMYLKMWNEYQQSARWTVKKETHHVSLD